MITLPALGPTRLLLRSRIEILLPSPAGGRAGDEGLRAESLISASWSNGIQRQISIGGDASVTLHPDPLPVGEGDQNFPQCFTDDRISMMITPPIRGTMTADLVNDSVTEVDTCSQ
jgi:hypothetical protein